MKELAVLLVLSFTSALAVSTPALADRGDITPTGQLDVSNGGVSDVWGYVDPSTGKYYALVGDDSGEKLYIIDVTDPSNPTLASEIDAEGRVYDVKAWGNYAYVCDSGVLFVEPVVETSRIIDISNPNAPVLLSEAFRRGHNLTTTPQGYLFLSGGGGIIGYDVANDPLLETEYIYQLDQTIAGHDATAHGDKLYDFAIGQGVDIWDLTTFPTPTLLQTIPHGYLWFNEPGVIAHSGDVTEDGRYLYVCDEASSEPDDIYVWDTWDSGATEPVTTIVDANATVHNLYIECDLGFASFYSAGFRVYDVGSPTQPQLLDEFDTNALSGAGISGAWGVYPFDDRGYVYISDTETGLWVFSVEGYTRQFVDATPPEFNASGQSSGVTWVDYDDDGDLDVLFIRLATDSELWRHNADGTYTLTATFSGLHQSAAWADHDNDGDLD